MGRVDRVDETRGMDRVNEIGWMKPGVEARQWSSGPYGCGSCGSLPLLRLRDGRSKFPLPRVSGQARSTVCDGPELRHGRT
jgi:hypothetical protein